MEGGREGEVVSELRRKGCVEKPEDESERAMDRRPEADDENGRLAAKGIEGEVGG